MADMTGNRAAFLGVESSFTGRRWLGPLPETERLAEAMVQRTQLPLELCRVLAARGVPADSAESHLSPKLRHLLPDPRQLLDMEKAASRIVTALDVRERIAIFADYDVDGGASAALILNWLRALGHEATLYIPDRIDEGYGPNVAAMEMLARDHSLIICVDCGTLSHEPILAAGPADVVVLDHHLGGEILPPALAVVNPNRQDEDGSLGHLCAAAIVFLVLVEANRQLRLRGLGGPDLMPFLDLVALATVADVAPLIGVNRAFVRQGLAVMASRGRPGLRALADIARMDNAPTTYTLGFVFGPRINAGGRIGQADIGARLLSTPDPDEAERLACRLEELNAERRGITARIREEAMAQVEARGADASLVWAAGEGWHPGVVGIVAAQLKEATGRPAVVIGFSRGLGKGSGRSVPGIDLGFAVQRLASEGLLLAGGGHRMAAGLSLRQENLGAAMARLTELLVRQGADTAMIDALQIDSLLMPEATGLELLEQIERAGPFGAAAPAPRFVIPSVPVAAQRFGDNHLRLRIGNGLGDGFEAVSFGGFDTALGHNLTAPGHQLFHLAGRLERNTWRGRARIQLLLEDAAPG